MEGELLHIPEGPDPKKFVTLQNDGLCRFTVPSWNRGKSWAKSLTHVNVHAKGGYALDGAWITCDSEQTAAVGTVVAVGLKDGERPMRNTPTSLFSAYVVTPIYLVDVVKESAHVNVAACADLISKPTRERVEEALRQLYATATHAMTQLSALGHNQFSEDFHVVNERKQTWVRLIDDINRELTRNDPVTNINDVDSAALAIVTAGYRDLVKKYHPDRGGSHEIMGLLSVAKKQLSEILEAVKE